MRIQFFDRTESALWVRKYHQDYIRDTIHNTANRRIRRYESIEDFIEYGLVDWQPIWRESLERIVRECTRRLWSWRRWLAATSWKFIAIDESVVDDGMPHTIHDAIVLPTWLIKEFQDTPPPLKSIETLLHEKIHTLQKHRDTAPFFHALYRAWGWQPMSAEDVPEMIKRTHRTNPDTPNWWSIAHPSDVDVRWIPCVRLRAGAGSLTDVDYFFARQIRGRELEWIPMNHGDRDVSHWYTRYYGVRSHCYHPDECSAVLLAAWLAAEWYAARDRDGVRKCDADRVLLTELSRME